jgi:hypothetical protein
MLGYMIPSAFADWRRDIISVLNYISQQNFDLWASGVKSAVVVPIALLYLAAIGAIIQVTVNILRTPPPKPQRVGSKM